MPFGLTGSITRKITELPGNIFCIDTGYMRPQLAACYLLEHGGSAAIIETGTGYSVETILAVIEYKNIRIEDVRYVMPTHVHLDHAGGAGHLMQEFPNAQLVIHPRGARHMVDPEKLWQGSLAVYGEETMLRLYGQLIPVAEDRLIIAEDNFELDLNGRKLLFIDTPGHARHHYSIYDQTTSGFFSGDTFGMAYRELYSEDRAFIMPTTTPVQFDPGAWYKTLDRYLTFAPERMYLTHFGMVENIEALAEDLRNRINSYEVTARKYAGDKNRHTMIKSAITEMTLQELHDWGCPLPAPACKGLLEPDFELNTMGLEVWLDKNNIGQSA